MPARSDSAALRQQRGKSMGDVDRTHEINPQDRLPVGGIELPEGKAELARADADRKNDVVAALEAAGRLKGNLANCRQVGYIRHQAKRFGQLCGQVQNGRITIHQHGSGCLGRESPCDRRADTACCPEHDDDALRKTEFH